MNKLKKAIRNLQDYLGADTQGVELLNRVSRLANEVRKSLTVCQNENEKLKESLEDYPSQLRSQKARIADLEAKNAQLRSMLAQRDLEVRKLRSQVLDEGQCSSDVYISESAERAEFRAIVKLLHGNPLPKMDRKYREPRALSGYECGIDGKVCVYDLDKLMASVKSRRVQYVGAALVALVRTFGKVTIATHRSVKELDVSNSMARMLASGLKANIDWESGFDWEAIEKKEGRHKEAQ